MKKRNESLFAVIVVTACLACVNERGARAADTTLSERERLRAARPERPAKAAVANHSEMKELRKVLEEKRRTVPKSVEAVQSEQRAIVRERLRTRAAANRAAAMNKDGKKEVKGEAREQARKLVDEANAGAAAGRRRD